MITDYAELETQSQSDDESLTDEYGMVIRSRNLDNNTSLILYIFTSFFACLFMIYFGIMIFNCPKILQQEMVFAEKCGEYQIPFFIFITMFFCMCTILMCAQIVSHRPRS